jgi:hypothetical protein
MKLFSDIEKTIERGLRLWTERVFGPGECDELVLVHRGVLEEIEARVQTLPRGKRVFPFNRVTVRITSAEAEKRELYRAALSQDGRLEKDVRESLDAAGVAYARSLAIEIEAGPAGEHPYAVECELREAPKPAASASASAATASGRARVVVTRGSARSSEYALTRARTLIGRTEELTDQEQRVIRRNDIVFEDGGDPANATVSRRHATIRHDAASGEYRIADDGSEFGTRIFRDGRGIDVPAGNRRGERLRGDDEIYLGRACLRFEIE